MIMYDVDSITKINPKYVNYTYKREDPINGSHIIVGFSNRELFWEFPATEEGNVRANDYFKILVALMEVL